MMSYPTEYFGTYGKMPACPRLLTCGLVTRLTSLTILGSGRTFGEVAKRRLPVAF